MKLMKSMDFQRGQMAKKMGLVEKRQKVFLEKVGLKLSDLNMNEKNHLEIFRYVNLGRENN